jgi:hypothetical protein
LNKKIIAILTMTLLATLLASTGFASASKAGFDHTIYGQAMTTTIDGRWTTTTEWDDSQMTTLQASDGGANGNAYFRDKYEYIADPFQIVTKTIVEVTTDTVANAGDYVEIDINGQNGASTTPQTTDYRLVLTPTTATWYRGTGTAWGALATPTGFSWATTISASPWSSTPHRIYEFAYDKTGMGIGDASGYISQRVAAYDADNTAAGVRAWPTSSNTVPNDWAYIPWSSTAIPESFGFIVVALLSCFAVVVGTVLVRKRSKVLNLSTSVVV